MRLPEPSKALLQHSQQLSQIITDTIIAQGAISFADFMQLALYYPGLGYYSAGKNKLGEGGDFTTAPEISPLYSFTLANYIAAQFSQKTGKNILEFGAGSGKMAADILLRLEQLEQLPHAYFILDVSADLRARQAETLAKLCPHLVKYVSWLDSLPAHFQGIMLANEVLDAMPVQLFYWQNNELYERCVDSQAEQFVWVDKAAGEDLKHYLATYLPSLPQPYLSEVNLAAMHWIKTVAASLTQGELLLIDYGFADPAFYHPERNTGTLMCHYQHLAHSDPLIWPGLQDITSHVHFDKIAETAVKTGLSVAEYDTQANFLMRYGILELAQYNDLIEQYQAGQALKKLLLPSEMGELFKVMRLSKKDKIE